MSKAPVEWAAEAPPIEMQSAKRWLLWSLEKRARPDGTTADVKIPRYAVDGQKRRGDLNEDGDRLVTYGQAVAALAMWGFAGLGFALGDGWQGIDFDKVDERLELAAVIHTLPGYVELSPSGRGVHAIGYGRPFNALGSNASGIEAYCVGRFFTFTGNALPHGPLCDLAPYVEATLAPMHAAHRKVGPVKPTAALPKTGDRTLDELADAIRHTDPDSREDWVNNAHALKVLGDAGFKIWSDWSATSTRFPGGDDLERWETFRGDRTGYASIFKKAEANGWKNPARLDPAAIFAGSSLVTNLEILDSMPRPPGMPPPPVAVPVPPGITPPPSGPPIERIGGQTYREADGRQRAASIENVVDAIGPASGMRIVFDHFQGVVMMGGPDGTYATITDADYIIMRETLGRGGFKPVGAEIMSSAVELVARRSAFDSATAWCDGLVWDGTPRIDVAMPTYYGTEDTPYTRAVGAYLFTALAGRALVPGIQADMAVVLVGVQGERKTSAVRALAPSSEAFCEVNLSKTDEQIAYIIRGKLVAELSEMRGVAGRDLEATKAWVTRRVEEWREPYRRTTTKYKRRCICVGTANENELFDDPTGERRWLPTMCRALTIELLEADRAQLWAEGVARFRASGIAWQDAERLAKSEHHKFKMHDEWSEFVAQWLESIPIPRPGEMPSPLKNGERPVALHQIALEALTLRKSDITRKEELRIGKILRSFGFEKTVVRSEGVLSKRWVKLP